MGMLRQIYSKYLRKKFFNKLLLVYTAIIVLSLFLLAVVISNNMYGSQQQADMNLNQQLAQSVSNYIDKKIDMVKNIMTQMYINRSPNAMQPDALQFLTEEYSNTSADYVDIFKRFDNFFLPQLSQDKSDLEDIMVYKSINSTAYLFSQYSTRPRDFYSAFDPSTSGWLKGFEPGQTGLQILPTHSQSYPDNNTERVYTLASNIKNYENTNNIGIIMFDYRADSIRSAFEQYDKNSVCSIMVFSRNGGVIFDSSGSYYDKPYPYFGRLRAGISTMALDGDSIVDVIVSENTGIVTAGIIPKSAIAAAAGKSSRTVYLISFVFMILAVLLTYISIRIFSKRIRLIQDAVKKVQGGDLDSRIAITSGDDEIGEIAVNFNNMCDNLKEYIGKAYLLEIKQKNAQLNFLQSQVNPHFLYNTLESIRMRAITKENKEIGDMIYILASMFKSSIKDEMIIKISDEINYCKLYLDLFDIRYADNLSVDFHIEEDISECGILKHLLQPLIENYIVHGFDPDRRDNRIAISAKRDGCDIVLEVADNGKGIDSARLEGIQSSLETPDGGTDSIGLANVNERIKITWGRQYGAEILSQGGCGTKVILKMPAMTKEELKNLVQSAAR